MDKNTFWTNLAICLGLWFACVILSAFLGWILSMAGVDDTFTPTMLVFIISQCGFAVLMNYLRKRMMMFPLTALALNIIASAVIIISIIEFCDDVLSKASGDTSGFGAVMQVFGGLGSAIITAAAAAGCIVTVITSFLLMVLSSVISKKIFDKKLSENAERIN